MLRLKKHHILLVIVIALALTACPASAQTVTLFPDPTPNDTSKNDLKNVSAKTKPVPLIDLTDVLSGLFSKKKKTDSIAKDPYVMKPVFSGVAAIGYTLQTRLAATISGNILFRTDSSARLSSITSNATYTQNKQFFWPIQSNIWTKKNKYAFIGDFRFYKYPQSTFGLGSNTIVENEDPMDYKFFRFYEYMLRKIKGDFYAGLGYIIDYRWDISHTGPKNGTISDYTTYGERNNTVSSGITLNGVFDNRDNPINPLHGVYTSLQYRTNFQALGSTSNWQSLILEMRKYFSLSERTQDVLALWSFNWLTLAGKPPFLDLPSNGWDSYSSTGRGYIQGRFRGAQMLYLESELRYRISRNGLLGGVLFLNAESFSKERGTKLEKVQPGFGAGLRIKIKKTSRTNLGIDYGFGTEGSKGLFITVGEYF